MLPPFCKSYYKGSHSLSLHWFVKMSSHTISISNPTWEFLNVFFLERKAFFRILAPQTSSLACDVRRQDLDTYKILGLNIGYNTHVTYIEGFLSFQRHDQKLSTVFSFSKQAVYMFLLHWPKQNFTRALSTRSHIQDFRA
jgi:hypothetical protein